MQGAADAELTDDEMMLSEGATDEGANPRAAGADQPAADASERPDENPAVHPGSAGQQARSAAADDVSCEAGHEIDHSRSPRQLGGPVTSSRAGDERAHSKRVGGVQSDLRRFFGDARSGL
eukprot:TRINITY_DN47806_c0_g1_i1.p2 TRINITY_DN47806_c0_g1~~TRINITY_DN47806_c0_g1_i1.p2  ORF type:complete len:121 (+),score=28.38 TRINITY_DN47806_c0_g1_i1:800-1162(+)